VKRKYARNVKGSQLVLIKAGGSEAAKDITQKVKQTRSDQEKKKKRWVKKSFKDIKMCKKAKRTVAILAVRKVDDRQNYVSSKKWSGKVKI